MHPAHLPCIGSDVYMGGFSVQFTRFCLKPPIFGLGPFSETDPWTNAPRWPKAGAGTGAPAHRGVCKQGGGARPRGLELPFTMQLAQAQHIKPFARGLDSKWLVRQQESKAKQS